MDAARGPSDMEDLAPRGTTSGVVQGVLTALLGLAVLGGGVALAVPLVLEEKTRPGGLIVGALALLVGWPCLGVATYTLRACFTPGCYFRASRARVAYRIPKRATWRSRVL